MSYDAWITSGNRHKCPVCGGTWYDSEWGCNCGTCSVCETVMDAEELGDSGICEDCELAELEGV